MRLKADYFLSGIIAFALSLLMIGGALAHHLGASQYWTARRGGTDSSCNQGDSGGSGGGSGNETCAREVKVFNQSPLEMFVLLIEYDEGLSFNECRAEVIGPSGSTTHGPMDRIDGRSYNEVIAVPTGGRYRGTITNHSIGVRVYRGTQRYPWTSADAKGFILRSGVESCACSELSSFGFPANLLSAFGIVC